MSHYDRRSFSPVPTVRIYPSSRWCTSWWGCRRHLWVSSISDQRDRGPNPQRRSHRALRVRLKRWKTDFCWTESRPFWWWECNPCINIPDYDESNCTKLWLQMWLRKVNVKITFSFNYTLSGYDIKNVLLIIFENLYTFFNQWCTINYKLIL